MIRIAVMTAALLVAPRLAEAKGSPLAQAPQAPQTPQAPRAPQSPPASRAPRAPGAWSFEFEVPELEDLLGIPDFDDLADLPGFADLERLRILPRLLARAGRSHDDDADDDHDSDHDHDKDHPPGKDEPGVHVYRMNQQRERIQLPRLRMRDEDGIDERNATAQAKGNGSATLPVKGPVTFRCRRRAERSRWWVPTSCKCR